MPEGTNRKWTLAARPVGLPKKSDFKLIESPIPVPSNGEALLKSEWLSLDPYMRGRMNAGQSYAPGVEIGGTLQGEVVAKVMESKTDELNTGDFVAAPLGWQEYGTAHISAVRKLNPESAPVSTALGIVGMPGLTAYFGLFDVIQPKPGDTLVVSAASGAVGAVVGQIGRMSGCRVIGIAGSEEKISYIVDELGFDVGINYKTEDVAERLSQECPDGIDCYFDNVGGPITDVVIENLATGARIAICGQISQYNLSETALGPRNIRFLLTKTARMQGFLVFNFKSRYAEGLERLASWVKSGQLKYREDVVDGFENMPDAFIGMMNGANFGKLLIRASS